MFGRTHPYIKYEIKIEKDVFLFSNTGGSEEKKLSIPPKRAEPAI